MNIESGFLALLNYIYIGLLPVVFFKKDGNLNLRWWLTAAPFLIASGTILANMLGYTQALIFPPPGFTYLPAFIAILCFSGSIALISFTLGTHSIPIALWHQENDAPKSIVTYGAYGKIRHPFYASFLLCFIGTVIECPHALTLLALVWGFLILNATAAREEKRLCQSEFGKDYQEYITKTGRFFPKTLKAN
jgi:protein-S-isoprenylcysteine O-methyltransferase Ste14